MYIYQIIWKKKDSYHL